MKVTPRLLWFLCSATLLSVPVVTFLGMLWAEGNYRQDTAPGFFVLNFVVLLLSPWAIRSTARSAHQLVEGASWLAWRQDQPLRSVTKIVALSVIGLSIIGCAFDTVRAPQNLAINSLTIAHLVAVALWLFALRATPTADAPSALKHA